MLVGHINGQSCIDGDCSYHNSDGGLRDDCDEYQSYAKCGQGVGSSTPSDQAKANDLADQNMDPDQKEEVEEAQEVLNTSVMDVVIDVAGEVLKDLIGINDIMACVGEGDMWSCATMIMDLIPWTKVIKLGAKLWKAAKRIYKAVTGFQDKLASARRTISKYHDAVKSASGKYLSKVKSKKKGRQSGKDDAPSCGVGNSFTKETQVVMADGTTKLIDEVEAGEKVQATDEETGETVAREVVMTREGTAERLLVEFDIDTDGDGETDESITATDEHPMWTADPAEVPESDRFGDNLGAIDRADDLQPDQIDYADGSGSGGGGPPAEGRSNINLVEQDDDSYGAPDDLDGESVVGDEPLTGQWTEAVDLKVGQLLRTSSGTWIQISAIESWTAETTVHNLTVADLHTYYVEVSGTDFLTHNAGECPNSGLPHGKMGEASTEKELQAEGYKNITSEVPFQTDGGTEFRADFVAQESDGNWKAFEVKTGPGAKLTSNQMIGYD